MNIKQNSGKKKVFFFKLHIDLIVIVLKKLLIFNIIYNINFG